LAVGGWGIAPSEFWRMTPSEFWLIYDAKTPPVMYGRLTEDEADELLKLLDEAQSEWI